MGALAQARHLVQNFAAFCLCPGPAHICGHTASLRGLSREGFVEKRPLCDGSLTIRRVTADRTRSFACELTAFCLATVSSFRLNFGLRCPGFIGRSNLSRDSVFFYPGARTQ